MRSSLAATRPALRFASDEPRVAVDQEIVDLECDEYRLALELESVRLRLRAARSRFALQHDLHLRRGGRRVERTGR